jgi:hypothetical protein
MAYKNRNLKVENKNAEHQPEKNPKDLLLKDVPLNERRKEAKKPLFLQRYE